VVLGLHFAFAHIFFTLLPTRVPFKHTVASARSDLILFDLLKKSLVIVVFRYKAVNLF
jgi:hypothetical protein